MSDKGKAEAQLVARLLLATMPPEYRGTHTEFGLKAVLDADTPVEAQRAIGMDGYTRNVKDLTEVGGLLHPDSPSPCCGRPNRECNAWQKLMTLIQTVVEGGRALAKKARSADDSHVSNEQVERMAGGERESAESFFSRLGVDFSALPKQ